MDVLFDVNTKLKLQQLYTVSYRLILSCIVYVTQNSTTYQTHLLLKTVHITYSVGIEFTTEKNNYDWIVIRMDIINISILITVLRFKIK